MDAKKITKARQILKVKPCAILTSLLVQKEYYPFPLENVRATSSCSPPGQEERHLCKLNLKLQRDQCTQSSIPVLVKVNLRRVFKRGASRRKLRIPKVRSGKSDLV